MYGVTATPYPDAVPFGVTAPVALQNEATDWKSKLQELLTKKLLRSLTKGEVAFTVSEVPGGAGYTASCQSPLFRAAYAGDQPAASKRAAEHAAARAAILEEFPGEGHDPTAQKATQRTSGTSGRKRTRGGDGAGGGDGAEDAKSRLMHGLQMLLQRPLQKGDVVFDTQQPQEGHGYHASLLALPTYDPKTTYESEVAESKKAAEASAAERALTALHDLIAAAQEEHTAKKRRLAQEKKAAKVNMLA